MYKVHENGDGSDFVECFGICKNWKEKMFLEATCKVVGDFPFFIEVTNKEYRQHKKHNTFIKLYEDTLKKMFDKAKQIE